MHEGSEIPELTSEARHPTHEQSDTPVTKTPELTIETRNPNSQGKRYI